MVALTHGYDHRECDLAASSSAPNEAATDRPCVVRNRRTPAMRPLTSASGFTTIRARSHSQAARSLLPAIASAVRVSGSAPNADAFSGNLVSDFQPIVPLTSAAPTPAW